MTVPAATVHGPRRAWCRCRRIVALAAVGWLLAGFVGGWVLTRGRSVVIPERSDLAGHRIEVVAATTADGLTVRGWLVRAAVDSHDCVVLAAGIRGNRTAMTSRAEWYLARGWSTLLIDLRATGESDGERVSMGWHEADDLRAWYAWLLKRGFVRLGAHGQSLGAAAIAYSDLPWDFAVLESCYVAIDEALRARLPWVPLPDLLLWPLRGCSEWWSGTAAMQLRPIDHVANRRQPTLFLAGDADEKVGLEGTQRLFAACAAVDKRMVLIVGGGHEDLLGHDRNAVLQALTEFVPAASR